jgi:hypothetical protein
MAGAKVSPRRSHRERECRVAHWPSVIDPKRRTEEANKLVTEKNRIDALYSEIQDKNRQLEE